MLGGLYNPIVWTTKYLINFIIFKKLPMFRSRRLQTTDDDDGRAYEINE